MAIFGRKIDKFAFFVQESSLAQYFGLKMTNFMIIAECCKNGSFVIFYDLDLKPCLALADLR